MSGGVDSSVAAALLQRQGCHCRGMFMITHDQAHAGQSDARQVADQLGIQLHVLDLRHDFREIIDYFLREYQAGRTPNPCVYCNRRIKFGRLWDYARDHGAEYIATGHYACIEPDSGQSVLYESQNTAKDQSYVLSMIPRDVLKHIKLPLSSFVKDETRRMAAELDLHIEQKPDSQEICFIPDDNHIGLLEQLCPELCRTGDVVDMDGQVLGQHEGIHRFTIGQRRGLGIALGEPAYVVRIDPENNTVVLGPREALMHKTLYAGRVNWQMDIPTEPFEAKVKIRYNHRGSPGTVFPEKDSVRIEFHEPVSAITPGQAAVMYIQSAGRWRVAGGGWINGFSD
jgi:tRNA-specific 2-thiouridylase